MRLLQTYNDGDVRLTEFFDSDIPQYAILSHRWGAEEVTFKDMLDDTAKNKPGYVKLEFCAWQARRDNLQYFWVDTCCIDKSSSAELQEAINSMFRWYQRAEKCYVYLADVSTGELFTEFEWEQAFGESTWFTRGWTLQELLAPRTVEFFSREALRGVPLYNFEVDTRLSWAKGRTTTRPEDEAYSLLGIFGVFIPFIYGEGKENAIERLKRDVFDAAKRDRGTMPQDHSTIEAISNSRKPEPEPKWKSLILPKDHGAPVFAVRFSKSGNTLASVSRDGATAKVWNLWSGSALCSSKYCNANVNHQATAFSPDSGIMVLASEGTIRFWDFWSGVVRQELKHNFKKDVGAMAISPDGRTLALNGHGRNCRLVDIELRATLQTLKHNILSVVHHVAFSPDGKLLASGTFSGRARLWDVGSGAMVHNFKLRHNQCSTLAFSPDGRTLASGSRGNVELWDVKSGEKVRTLKRAEPQYGVWGCAIAFSPDGKTLASGFGNGAVILWNVGSGEELRTLGGHTGIVNTLAFSTDGRVLASGSEDHTVRLWGLS